MAQWKVTEKDRDLFKKFVSDAKLKTSETSKLSAIVKKEVLNFEDITTIKEVLPSHIPICAFFSNLQLHQEEAVYKASPEFRAKTERLKKRFDQEDYKRLIKSIDPAQKYGRIDHMENFGAEMRTVNRQVMSVVNVLITVVGAFFFGFSGVTYAYPHLKLDLAVRFIIGLVPATIVFFADLYFIVKNLDQDDHPTMIDQTPSGQAFSFKNMEQKKNE